MSNWIGARQLTAAEFVNIDFSIPAVKVRDDNEHLRALVDVDGEEEKKEKDMSVAENQPN